MYLSYYGFQEKPFTITPNPRFIFLSKNHREAFAHLLYGVRSQAGFMMLTGEIGTGKTTILRGLLHELGDVEYRAALILNPCLSATELLRAVNREFGLPDSGSKSELLQLLNQFLLEHHRQGRTVLLVIDESQNLDADVLEQIRLISNLETDTQKLIQIILSGQPEFSEILRRKELRQLAQRITVSYHLRPMDNQDVRSYIQHRLIVAGFWGKSLFTSSAMRLIYRYSGGTPRLINILCDRALLVGYTEEAREIGARTVTKAHKELRLPLSPRRWRPAIAIAVILMMAAAFFPLLSFFDRKPAPLAAAVPSPPMAETLSTTLIDSFRAAFAASSERESAVKAFGIAAGFWNVKPGKLTNDARDPLAALASASGLELHRFQGSLDSLLRMGCPAILELYINGLGRRHLVLTGRFADGIVVSPTIGGRSSFSRTEIETVWLGRAYVPWRDHLAISPASMETGSKDNSTRRLQQLLKVIGLYGGTPNGVYDRETVAAVKAFQAKNGISPDGMAGSRTLLLLYKVVGNPPVPALAEERSQR